MKMNPLVLTDSYKLSHPPMYPDKMNLLFDYMEARSGGRWKETVFFGMQMYIKDILLVPFTQEDIDEAVMFYNMHFPPVYANKLFDKECMQYILKEYGGVFPVVIKAVPEGTPIPESNVLCTFTCDDPKAAASASFLEALATSYVWYGSTVATNAYNMKKTLIKYGTETSDSLDWLPFALHDFGCRGVAPGAQAVGGAAVLTCGMGSDTLPGIYAAWKQYGIKEGLPGYSIPASEHSVMCSRGRDGEFDVVRAIVDEYAVPGGIFAIVNDTYNTEDHIRWVCENLKEQILESGARWVTRPDSGYPPEIVVTCLELLEEYWGTTVNSKGYKVLPPSVRVIQGDGIDEEMLVAVLEAVRKAGFSTENVAFGSGGGLLQKVNRDTQRFAMKASYIEVDGVGYDVFKQPTTQTGDYNKQSKKGKMRLVKAQSDMGVTYVTVKEDQFLDPSIWEDVLETVYDKGKLVKEYTFDEVRANTCLW